jgi:hypothetical protein
MATGRFRVGYPRVSSLAGSGSGPETNQVRFQVWFSTRGYPMDIRNKSFRIKTHVFIIC